MKAVREKIDNADLAERYGERYYIFCPGCFETYKLRYPEEPGYWMNGALHCFSAKIHTFDGNLEAPTLSPSLLVKHNWGEARTPYVCHSFVREGRIEFLSDCTHPLAGQTVDLLEVPEKYLDGVS